MQTSLSAQLLVGGEVLGGESKHGTGMDVNSDGKKTTGAKGLTSVTSEERQHRGLTN